jgi:DNA-binding MarR family transcriptional regulator
MDLKASLATLDSRTRRALDTLFSSSPKGLTKGDIALRVWGERNASSQSMATRLTSRLRELGWIEEGRDGRQIVVHLTVEGKKALAAVTPAIASAKDETDPIGRLLNTKPDAWKRPERPFDRPYYHLVQAAVAAGVDLKAKDEKDICFARVLLTLLDSHASEMQDAKRDAEDITYIVNDWKKLGADPRLELAAALAPFGKDWEREHLAVALFKAHREIASTSAGVQLLWVAAATAVARRLKLLRHPQADADHAKLLRLINKTLDAIESVFPVHAHYFRAISRITDGELRVEPWLALIGLSEEAPAIPADIPKTDLAERLTQEAKEIFDDASFNRDLSLSIGVLEQRVYPHIARHTSLAPRFREERSPYVLEAWALEYADGIDEALPSARKEFSDVDKEILRKLAAHSGPGALGFQGAQARYLLEGTLPETNEPREYDRLLRNNYWTGVQLWIDVAMRNSN